MGHDINALKLDDQSWLIECEYDCYTVPDTFWKAVKYHIQDIVTYTEQMQMASELHSTDINLLLEVVTKHFLWDLEYPF